MCLALPAKIKERDGLVAWVTVGQADMRISVIMTPDASVGDWVLVHAGFAIRQVEEKDAIETWQLIEEVQSRAATARTETGEVAR